jgi:hypothetical protein
MEGQRRRGAMARQCANLQVSTIFACIPTICAEGLAFQGLTAASGAV